MNAIKLTGSEEFEIRIENRAIDAFGFEEAMLYSLVYAIASGRRDAWVSLSDHQITKMTGIPWRRHKKVIDSVVDLGLLAFACDIHDEHNMLFMVILGFGNMDENRERDTKIGAAR